MSDQREACGTSKAFSSREGNCNKLYEVLSLLAMPAIPYCKRLVFCITSNFCVH